MESASVGGKQTSGNTSSVPNTSAVEAVVPFHFGEKPIRTVLLNGRQWFVAADICDALELTDHRATMRRLDDDEHQHVVLSTSGGPQDCLVTNESGVYHLAFISRKPVAKRFRRWVTDEVLPQIRRTGSYGPNESGASEQPEPRLRPLKPYEENVLSELRRVGCFVVSRPLEGEITIERHWFGEQLQRFSLTDVHMLGHMVKLLGLSWSYYQQEQALRAEMRGPLGIASAKVQLDDHIKMAVTQAEKIGRWLEVWGDGVESVYAGIYGEPDELPPQATRQ